MDKPSTSMRKLARRMLIANRTAADSPVREAMQVFQTLRSSLARLVGVDGVTALLNRALALASEEVPALKDVTLGLDGRLERFEELVVNTEGPGVEAAVVVTAHLLKLLMTFVGEPLTLRLLRESWPGLSLDEYKSNEADS